MQKATKWKTTVKTKCFFISHNFKANPVRCIGLSFDSKPPKHCNRHFTKIQTEVSKWSLPIELAKNFQTSASLSSRSYTHKQDFKFSEQSNAFLSSKLSYVTDVT